VSGLDVHGSGCSLVQRDFFFPIQEMVEPASVPRTSSLATSTSCGKWRGHGPAPSLLPLFAENSTLSLLLEDLALFFLGTGTQEKFVCRCACSLFSPFFPRDLRFHRAFPFLRN